MPDLSQIFSDFFAWMGGLAPFWIYVVIFLIAYGENVLPPVPGDMVVVFGGYLAAVGKLDLWLVILLSTLGGGLGFMTMFVLGVRLGEAVFETERLRWLPRAHIRRAQAWIARWGYGVVAANRFLSGARSVISLTVGMARMHPLRVALLATLSALVWTALIAGLGYQVGENWAVIGGYLRSYGRLVAGLLALVALFFAARFVVRRRRGKQEPEAGNREA